MGRFVQIIEMQTSRFDEIEAVIREIRTRLDDGSPSTADRQRCHQPRPAARVHNLPDAVRNNPNATDLTRFTT